MNTAILEARNLIISRPYHKVTIYLIGCGGTGSWTAPHLARMAKILESTGISTQLYFVDHDKIEEANLARQNFISPEVGMYKALALAMRYSTAYGLKVEAVTNRFKPGLLNQAYGEVSLIIGCVDNPKARQQIAKSFEGYQPYPLFWIDSGNAAINGQVSIGTTGEEIKLRKAFPEHAKVCIELPLPTMQMPGLIEEADPNEATPAPSCLELSLRSAQSLTINQTMASVISNYVVRLLSGTLNFFQTFVNIKSGTMQSIYLTPQQVATTLNLTESFFQESPDKNQRFMPAPTDLEHEDEAIDPSEAGVNEVNLAYGDDDEDLYRERFYEAAL